MLRRQRSNDQMERNRRYRSRLRFQQLEQGRDNCDAGSPIRWLYHNPRSVDVSKFARVKALVTSYHYERNLVIGKDRTQTVPRMS